MNQPDHYHGEDDEIRTFRERFGSIVRNWWGIMRQQKRLTRLTAGYGQAAVIFPLINPPVNSRISRTHGRCGFNDDPMGLAT